MRRFAIFCLISLAGLPGPAAKGEAESATMTYVHSAPDSDQDMRAQPAWEVLRQALERTRNIYGDYRIVTAAITQSQRRLGRDSDGSDRVVNIALLPVPAPSEQRRLTAVRIPVYRGLWGYRVLLIRAGDQGRFDNVTSLAALQSLTIGQAEYWADVSILKNAGLRVVTGESYEGLFKMLKAGRFDAFSRSVVEVRDELNGREDLSSGLAVERHLLLHYPMPEYFWFPNDAAGNRLAERARVGLMSMVADGSLQRMIEESLEQVAGELHLENRQVIELPNPLLTSEDPVDDRSFWYRPGGHK